MFRGICNGVARLSSITKCNFTCLSDSIQLNFPYHISIIFFILLFFIEGFSVLITVRQAWIFNSTFVRILRAQIFRCGSFSLRQIRYSMYTVACIEAVDFQFLSLNRLHWPILFYFVRPNIFSEQNIGLHSKTVRQYPGSCIRMTQKFFKSLFLSVILLCDSVCMAMYFSILMRK